MKLRTFPGNSNAKPRRAATVHFPTVALLAAFSFAAPAPVRAVDGFDENRRLALEPIAAGLTLPVALTSPPGEADRLFVIEQRVEGRGRIRIIEPAGSGLRPEPFLEVPDVGAHYEEGLLGLAFAPDYAESGRFYVYYTTVDETVNPIPPHHASRLERYERDANDPNRADPKSAYPILSFPQPSPEHNGGWLAFGGDGCLYLSSGDGGPAMSPSLAAQAMEDDAATLAIDESLMGRVLRIDPHGDAFPHDPKKNYAIPADNPFAESAAPETWILGLRNPWRCSLDRENGDAWLSDVGNFQREEINWKSGAARGGENFGWPFSEGSAPTAIVSADPAIAVSFVSPVVEYGREVGGCVVGGHVYRGAAIPWLRGTYIYADFAMGWVRSFRFDGRVRCEERDWTAQLEGSLPPGSPTLANIASLGEDADGELYLVDLGGEIYRLVGR